MTRACHPRRHDYIIGTMKKLAMFIPIILLACGVSDSVDSELDATLLQKDSEVIVDGTIEDTVSECNATSCGLDASESGGNSLQEAGPVKEDSSKNCDARRRDDK